MMVFTQLRSGTAGAAQDDAHFAALRRDLDAESGHTRIPVDYIRVWRPQRVDDTLGQFDARHERGPCPAVLLSPHIGSTANEMAGANVILGPH